MRVLVTGGEGQLGRALGRQVGWLRLGRGQLDITDGDVVNEVIRSRRPDVVVNAAAYTAVDRAEEEPARAWAVNAEGVGHLAEACAGMGIPLVQVSTDYVFDGTRGSPMLPSDPVSPLGVYGASKAEGEARARRWERHVILRTAWVFGPDRPGFVGAIARKAATGEQIEVVADQWGNPTPADGLAAAVIAVVSRIGEGPWGTWHAAGQPATTWFGLATEVVRVMGVDVGLRPIPASAWPTRARRPADGRLDTSAFEERFGVRLGWKDHLKPAIQAALGRAQQ